MARTGLALFLSAGLVSLGATLSPVSAAPVSVIPNPASGTSLVENTQAYHRNCTWVNGAWNYKRGNSYVVHACPLSSGTIGG